MISYYDLLGLIRNGNAPEYIRAKICSYSCDYKAEYDGEEFNYYTMIDEHKVDENYRSYLHECYLESCMFDKTIEILKPLKNGIEKLPRKHFHRKQRKLADKINEIIDILNI